MSSPLPPPLPSNTQPFGRYLYARRSPIPNHGSRAYDFLYNLNMASDHRPGRAIFLDGKVDEALQHALALQDRPQIFEEIILQLQKHADETLRFTMPIWPQPAPLHLFVEKAMRSFPHLFGSCGEDIALLHHLQRYAACYLAYKIGYFQRREPRSRKRTPAPSNKKAQRHLLSV
ncbi:hypothetical protein B0H11DRAFT_162639 [Mycena galericulata]|nr:hypothetical protein B0H11DRAFT_162639 [Mycena galericulata]